MVKFAVEFWWKMLLTIFPNKRSSKISFQTSPEVRHQFRRKLRQLHSGNRRCLQFACLNKVLKQPTKVPLNLRTLIVCATRDQPRAVPIPKSLLLLESLEGLKRQSPLASVQRTRSTLAGHSAIPCGTNVELTNANRAIQIATQRTQGLRGPISAYLAEI